MRLTSIHLAYAVTLLSSGACSSAQSAPRDTKSNGAADAAPEPAMASPQLPSDLLDASSSSVHEEPRSVTPGDAAFVPTMLDASLAPSMPDASLEAAPAAVRAVAEHACQHGRHGPYRDLVVTASSMAPFDVSRPHTAYRLRTADTSALATVRYVARAAAEHVVLASRELAWFEQSDASVRRPYEVADSCSLLPVATVRELGSGEALEFSFTLTLGHEVMLVIEQVGETPEAQPDHPDGSLEFLQDGGGAAGDAAVMCRSSGPCSDDSECCDYCHDFDHCH